MSLRSDAEVVGRGLEGAVGGLVCRGEAGCVLVAVVAGGGTGGHDWRKGAGWRHGVALLHELRRQIVRIPILLLLLVLLLLLLLLIKLLLHILHSIRGGSISRRFPLRATLLTKLLLGHFGSVEGVGAARGGGGGRERRRRLRYSRGRVAVSASVAAGHGLTVFAERLLFRNAG